MTENEAPEQNGDEEQDLSIAFEEGRRVFSHLWDTGGLGGSDYDLIYEYDGAYYAIFNYSDIIGPYGTLEDAIESHDLGLINNATARFDTELPLEDLLPLLYAEEFDEDQLPHHFLINGEPWQLNEDLSISRAGEE